MIEMLLMTQPPLILGIPQNLKLWAREQGVTVAHHCNKSNTDSCTVSSRRAAVNSSPCQHDGVCEQGWFRPICMCERTAYYGSTCHQGTYTALIVVVEIKETRFYHLVLERPISIL